MHLGAADIDMIARTRTTPVHNSGSNLRLCNGIAPLAGWLNAGVTVAIGTDNCPLSDTEDLLGELRLADLWTTGPGLRCAPACGPITRATAFNAESA